MKVFNFLLVLTSFYCLNSCSASKMSQAMSLHKANLSKALTLNEDPSKQMDILGETYVQVINEALSYGSIKNSVKHIKAFSNQNKTEIDAIMKNLNNWTSDFEPAEKLMMIGKLASKPYASELLSLVPKLERKVNRRISTFTFLSQFVDIFSLKLF